MGWESSGRALRANPRWCACWSASGGRCAAGSRSTAGRWTIGLPRRSASMSATCRRTWSCSPGRWPWAAETLGQHVGYLPQDVELLAGTVAENICRFESGADAKAIIAAAQAAGVHELILNLSDGYDTPIGEQGASLSAGQRQRVALARALYRDPFLVVLDEPSSNLDAVGEEALTQAILGVRSRGGIIVVVAHRPSALAAVDHLLVMNQGRAQAFGPKDQVAAKMVRPEPAPPLRSLKVVPDV